MESFDIFASLNDYKIILSSMSSRTARLIRAMLSEPAIHIALISSFSSW